MAAMKVSDDSLSITSEVNVLKHFSKVQGSALGPSLLDVDDWTINGGRQQIPFYIMEYIEGEQFLSFINKRGKEWTGILCLQLLSDLGRLHQAGWVFGDLKPDNLLVTERPPRIRCIDVGGTTLQGRAIKEYTEFFDRGYWGLGSRKAEPSYDLFAVAMIMVNAAYPNRFPKKGNTLQQLQQAINGNPWLNKYNPVLFSALKGKYQSAGEMRADLSSLMSSGAMQDRKQPDTPVPRSAQTAKKPDGSRTVRLQNQKQNMKKKKGGWAETLLILALVLSVYWFYVYGQLLQ